MSGERQKTDHGGRIAPLAIVSGVLWIGVAFLTMADIDHRVPGIIAAMVGLVAAVTTIATVQVWCADDVIYGRHAQASAVTGHGTYHAVNPADIRWLIPQPVAAGPPSVSISADTEQLPSWMGSSGRNAAPQSRHREAPGEAVLGTLNESLGHYMTAYSDAIQDMAGPAGGAETVQ